MFKLFRKALPKPPQFSTDPKYDSDLAKWFEEVDQLIDEYFKLGGKYNVLRIERDLPLDMLEHARSKSLDMLESELNYQKTRLTREFYQLSTAVSSADTDTIIELRRSISGCRLYTRLLKTAISEKSAE